jgi:hypothetical protein
MPWRWLVSAANTGACTVVGLGVHRAHAYWAEWTDPDCSMRLVKHLEWTPFAPFGLHTLLMALLGIQLVVLPARWATRTIGGSAHAATLLQVVAVQLLALPLLAVVVVLSALAGGPAALDFAILLLFTEPLVVASLARDER